MVEPCFGIGHNDLSLICQLRTLSITSSSSLVFSQLDSLVYQRIVASGCFAIANGRRVVIKRCQEVKTGGHALTLRRASLSGTFLQTLPDLVMPLKRHSLSPRSCPPTRSAPSERFGYYNHTPSIAFRYLPPNSARFSYATEGVLFISAQLSTEAVSALRKVRVLICL